MPVTYLEAKEAGTLDDYEWSDGCDPDTGRLKAPSVYAAPCVPVFTDDDNGGATTSGVTADKVTIVRYVAEQSADLQSLIAGIDATDTKEELAQTHRDYLTLSSSLARDCTAARSSTSTTREPGTGDDVVAAKADATQIVAGAEAVRGARRPRPRPRDVRAGDHVERHRVHRLRGADPGGHGRRDGAARLVGPAAVPISSCRRSTRGAPTSRRRPTAARTRCSRAPTRCATARARSA